MDARDSRTLIGHTLTHVTAGVGIVDANRAGRRYIVHSDELLTGFLHLEARYCDFTLRFQQTAIVLDSIPTFCAKSHDFVFTIADHRLVLSSADASSTRVAIVHT